MQESTVTIKGQTTLPKDIRQALNLKPGDKLRYLVLDGDEVRIVRSRPVAGLAGMLHQTGRKPVSLDAMDAAIAKGAADEGNG
tara:strand:+ start:5002 stop:5250 length:249 start_codon:yes stop_codon:yes gene_type:complete